MQYPKTTIPTSMDVLIEVLRAHTQGEVILPGDAAYDDARGAWNLSVDQHPAIIVKARCADDVTMAVRFAQEVSLPVAVQSTGHGVARKADGAVLIVTAGMNDFSIDPESRTAWIQAGAQWGPVLMKAQEFGLAPLLGSSPGVGAIGYTLGGGMGWLARKYGMAVDSVLAFEIVTADGQQLTVSETNHSDLFWGLRGSGGSLAIVTAMQIRLFPVTTVYGGTLIYPASQAKAAFQMFRAWTNAASDDLTASIAVMNLPPIPALPEFLRGQSVVMVNACFAGAVEDGAALIQPWLDWAEPLANSFHAMPFTEVGSISNDPINPSPGKSSGAWLAELSDEAIDTLLQYALPSGGPPALVKTEVRLAAGQIAHVAADTNAYSHRDENYLVQMIGITPTPELHQHVTEHIQAFKAALKPHLSGGVYLNFLEGDEKAASLNAAFSAESAEQLRVLKSLHDPDNRFSHAVHIPLNMWPNAS
jgi:FAD/FMN-containing dehydrogenase